MSGEVIVKRVFPQAEVVLRQGIRRAIAVQIGPDGKPIGSTPAEYFAGVKQRYDAVMDSAAEEIAAYLESIGEQAQLLKMDEKGGRRLEFQSEKERERVEIVIRSQKKLEQALAREVTARIQGIVDAHLGES